MRVRRRLLRMSLGVSVSFQYLLSVLNVGSG